MKAYCQIFDTGNVQESPEVGLVLHEKLVSDFGIHELKPSMELDLTVDQLEVAEGRDNAIVKYASSLRFRDQTLVLVGAHTEVVPANLEGWQRDPITLIVKGDKIYGYGASYNVSVARRY